MPLSAMAKRKLVGMETDACTCFLIEITNEELGTFRYVNLGFPVEYEGKTYSAAGFNISPPEKSEGKVGNSRISISAVDQEWIQRIRTPTKEKSRMHLVSAVVYEGDGGTEVESIDELDFTLTQAEWDDVTISWDMEFDDVTNINVPCDVADSLNFPGCG